MQNAQAKSLTGITANRVLSAESELNGCVFIDIC
jgi:hypothetical protein